MYMYYVVSIYLVQRNTWLIEYPTHYHKILLTMSPWQQNTICRHVHVILAFAVLLR